jgi:restriction system protein
MAANSTAIVLAKPYPTDWLAVARKKNSSLDDVLELFSLLPWWVGVLVAVVSYLLLSYLAQHSSMPAMTSSAGATSAGNSISRSVISGFASVGQFVVPFIALVGSALSFLRRKRSTDVYAAVSGSKSASALNDMTWLEFEMLVAESYRLDGYAVTLVGGHGSDGGVDVILIKDGETFLVQCKQWKAFKVGVDVVRSLYGVMAARGAAGGFVVTSGKFTAAAIQFAHGRNIELVDGSQLHQRIVKAKNSVSSHKARDSINPQLSSASTGTPDCPRCGLEMLKRTARKGANTGSYFWGCSKFPACRGIRPID